MNIAPLLDLPDVESDDREGCFIVTLGPLLPSPNATIGEEMPEVYAMPKGVQVIWRGGTYTRRSPRALLPLLAQSQVVGNTLTVRVPHAPSRKPGKSRGGAS